MEVLRILIDRHKNHREAEESPSISHEKALGLLIAQYLRWNGQRILEAMGEALEDANYHSEAGVVRAMHKELRTKNGTVNTK